MNATTSPQPAGAPAADIDSLRAEIDQLDAEILRLIKRRTVVSQQVGWLGWPPADRGLPTTGSSTCWPASASSAPRAELGMLLLRLGRGKLGSS